MTTINSEIFKAYDVRGLFPTQIDADAAFLIGQAYVVYLDAKKIAVGRDMRTSAPEISAAFIEGARKQGADVVDYGMIGTDMLYYAVARGDFDGGAEITASHNPKEYIGLKLVRQHAIPLSSDAGIGDIRDMILHDQIPTEASRLGSCSKADILSSYLEHVRSFVDLTAIQPFRLVLDAGSGIAGMVAPPLLKDLPCHTTELCFEVDGTFPHHEANPLIEENRRDIVNRVIAESADAGIAWDGDADRCFFIDGDGGFVPGDFITALLAEAFLRKAPGSTIVYDVRASYAVKDTVKAHGGSALMNRVGHAFFKKRMRDEDAIFGGEVTGHYYFRDNYFADNGFIPALLLLELMSIRKETLSGLLAPLRSKYFITGELNTEMPDMTAVAATIDRLAAQYQNGHVYRMDGVSVEYDTWHFNVRPSNTEPLIRLNLEATTQSEKEDRRDEVLEQIRRG
jgi:phosphomannomutase